MNSIERQFTLLPEQVKILRHRGLIINDSDEANHYLAHVGFYRLAGTAIIVDSIAFNMINEVKKCEGKFQLNNTRINF